MRFSFGTLVSVAVNVGASIMVRVELGLGFMLGLGPWLCLGLLLG